MTKDRGGAALRHIRTLFSVGAVATLTDGQLLERFATQGGEPAELAFAALVERHGPMVLRVCRRVLADPHDAHDAFQATFLVLVRRAGAIRLRDSLASWLHGVAYRTACCARSATARRRRHERKAADRAAETGSGERPDDLGPVLHEEINRLPERYRAVVVLCLLEGLTREQAARHLGWPVGTVQSCLARGRERLRGRLTRRGLAPAVGALGVVSPSESMAALPTALVNITVSTVMRVATDRVTNGVVAVSVLSLMEGALKTMMLAKLKVVACGLLSLAVIVVGAGVLLGQDSIDEPKAAAGGGTATPSVRVRLPEIDPILDHIEKLKRLLLAASQRLEAQTAFYEEGRITVDRFLHAMEAVEAAESQIATTKAARHAAIEILIARIERLLRDEQAKLETGRGKVADLAEVEQHLEAARLRRAEETVEVVSAREMARGGDGLDVLKERLLAAARRRLVLQTKSLHEGRLAVDRLLDAMSQVTEAELKIARTRADRRAAVESLVRNVEQLLRDEQAKLEAGSGTVANVAEVQQSLEAARLRRVEEGDERQGAEKPANTDGKR